MTSLPVGETATSWYLTVSAVGSEILATLLFLDGVFFFFFLLSLFLLLLITERRPRQERRERFLPVILPSVQPTCAQDDRMETSATVETSPHPALEKTPGKQ